MPGVARGRQTGAPQRCGSTRLTRISAPPMRRDAFFTSDVKWAYMAHNYSPVKLVFTSRRYRPVAYIDNHASFNFRDRSHLPGMGEFRGYFPTTQQPRDRSMWGMNRLNAPASMFKDAKSHFPIPTSARPQPPPVWTYNIGNCRGYRGEGGRGKGEKGSGKWARGEFPHFHPLLLDLNYHCAYFIETSYVISPYLPDTPLDVRSEPRTLL